MICAISCGALCSKGANDMATVEARSPHSGRLGASKLSVGHVSVFSCPLFFAPFKAPSKAVRTISWTTP